MNSIYKVGQRWAESKSSNNCCHNLIEEITYVSNLNIKTKIVKFIRTNGCGLSKDGYLNREHQGDSPLFGRYLLSNQDKSEIL
jgi:hypothetical protein